VALFLGIWLAALAGGCARRLDAKRLPAEVVAPQSNNLGELNLARLGGYAASTEQIGRGDVLEVTVVTDYGSLPPNIVPVRVNPDGTAQIPPIGLVQVAGLEMMHAEQAIAAAAIERGIYRNPHVTVTMKQQRKNRVTVIGAVEKPGAYDLPPGTSFLLPAIVAAGGLKENASPDVEIRRSDLVRSMPDGNQPQAAGVELTGHQEPAGGAAPSLHINLVSATETGNGNYHLNDGDTLMVVPREPKPVFVLGLVNRPGKYEMPVNQDLYLLDALAMAGDRSMELADRVLIVRQVPGHAAPYRIRASINEAQTQAESNVRLAEGDVVMVEQTPVTFAWSALRSFFRFSIGSSVALF
jgi:polysaccharide export outer membrane protein